MQIVIAVMHLGRLGLASNTLSVLVAFQVLLLWIKAQYFARCTAHSRPVFPRVPRVRGGCLCMERVVVRFIPESLRASDAETSSCTYLSCG